MMAAQVKICGVASRGAYAAARDAGADYVGLVFFRRSPRFVTAAQAAEIVSDGPGPVRVGLFVQPRDDEIAVALDAVRLDALQLYTDPARVRAIRARFGVECWRAVAVASRDDLPRDAEGADRLVIEARAPAGATRPGGNAISLDWSLLAHWDAPAPWILAGGLTPDNVGEAIAASGAVAVDVSSGVETAPGVKDAAAIARFVAAARRGGSGRAAGI